MNWATDSSYIVLSGPAGRETYLNKHLTRVDLTGGAHHPLTRNVRWSDIEPAVSPNGRRIAFIRGPAGNSAEPVSLISSRQLFLTDAHGTHLHRLSNAPGWSDAGPIWSPDGRWLLFVRWHRQQQGKPARAALWAIRPNGADARRLAPLDLPAAFNNGFGYYGSFDWKDLFSVAP
jgi:Tol biopolymer transport system component